jgi:predicted membrane protein
MRFLLFRLPALLALTCMPALVLAAPPSPAEIWITCDGLPGCGPGFQEHVSGALRILWNNMPVYVYMLATLFIMIGGGYMVFSFGETERITKGKTTILWALIAILVMQYAKIFVENVLMEEVRSRVIGSDLATSVIATLMSAVFDVLQVTMFGVAMYCGMRMVTSFGQEEEFKKFRDGMIWAAIGAIVINLAVRIAQAFCLNGVC